MDFYETKRFINNCIDFSSQSIDDVFNWLKENQNESKYVFLFGIISLIWKKTIVKDSYSF